MPDAGPERPGRRVARLAALVVGGGAALALVLHFAAGGEKPKDKGGDLAIPVTAGPPAVRPMPIWLQGVGTVSPLNAVDVKARVDGQLISLAFREGQDVRAGAVLAQIDPRPYKALVDQAAANLAKDQAQLANAKLDFDRATKLAGLGAGTGQNADTLRAQVAALAATVAADRAQLDSARLNLEFTTIRSPVTGRVGIRQVDPGAMIHASDATGIVTVTQMQPIAVLFTLSQDDLPAIRKAGANAPVAAMGRAEGAELARGALSVVDSSVDSANGKVRMKAVFANQDHALWPGSLIAARLRVSVQDKALLVPSSAIQTSQDGTFVYLVKPDHTVMMRPVKAGASADGQTAILTGVAPGDVVVFSGQSRLESGTRVEVRAPSGASS